MASFVLTTYNNTTQSLGSGEVGLISDSGVLATGFATAVQMYFATLINDGLIFSQNFAISAGSNSSIENHGAISSTGNAVISAYGETPTDPTALTLTNYGSITSSHIAAFSTIYLDTGGNRIVNYGEISSVASTAIHIGGFYDPTASTVIINFGRIFGGTWAIQSITSDNDTLQNRGDIIGHVSLGNGDDRIVNSGLIDGDIVFGTGSAFFRNSGHVAGDVTGSSGAGIYDLRGGMIAGSLTGGAGGDTYIVNRSDVALFDTAGGQDKVRAWCNFALSDGIEELHLLGTAVVGQGSNDNNLIIGNAADNALGGGIGNDSIDGMSGQDRIMGGAGADLIYGNEGDDSLFGGGDADVLNGNVGEDVLSGARGHDLLQGGDDADQLMGGAENDTLYGEAGDDVLTGGRGRDSLFGGADVDTFIFLTLGDSGTATTARDYIVDFQRGVEVIDLRAIDAVTGGVDDAFTFIGALAFSLTAGELRHRVSGAITIVEGDVNGDGVADFAIGINGTTAMSVRDFLL